MGADRNIYLNMVPLEKARQIIFDHFAGRTPDVEVVETAASVGRILAEPVTAVRSSPAFHVAAMDGIAVNAEDTFGASDARPKTLDLGRTAYWVNTGHALSPDTNAVIMIEQLQMAGESRVIIEAPAYPWQHVRKVGEDIVATELLFPRNHCITPYCIGALLAGGVFTVKVKKKPHVLILPTGNELVDPANCSPADLGSGQVIESNSHVLGRLAEAHGARYTRHAILADDLERIRRTVKTAATPDVDLILVCGGSSAGSEDYTKKVIQGVGEVLVHGVAMMPGKPVIIGDMQGKPVFGVPGYPVSAIMAFEEFIGPLITMSLGQPAPQRPKVNVELTRKAVSKLGIEEFLRVKLGRVGDRIVATPLPRGAGAITTLTEAHGIIRIPAHMEGLSDQTPVEAELLHPLERINATIVAVGSHDNTLDVLADQLKAASGHITLSSSHVGSMGGLMAVKKGRCHVAGIHLLDTGDGTYNLSYVRKYLAGLPVKLVHLVYRDQGLMVAKGNPKNIRSLQDLADPALRFINRQAGSGTRILLDYKLSQLGMDAGTITGYDTEEFTHMAVAVAVFSGTADVGLGIQAAAKALDLDFIPVITEQYDLVIPEEHFENPMIQSLLDIIRTEEFKSRVTALGGYSTVNTGKVLL